MSFQFYLGTMELCSRNIRCGPICPHQLNAFLSGLIILRLASIPLRAAQALAENGTLRQSGETHRVMLHLCPQGETLIFPQWSHTEHGKLGESPLHSLRESMSVLLDMCNIKVAVIHRAQSPYLSQVQVAFSDLL